jgi:putative ABC transport system permease protein
MFLALRDLRVAKGRFAIVGLVVALIALLATVLSGLAAGLVDDGISGLRALPVDHLAFQPKSGSSFGRSVLGPENLAPFEHLEGVEATPIGVSFVNAKLGDGESLDVALFGVQPNGFLAEYSAGVRSGAAQADLHGGLVLSGEDAGKVKVGDRVTISGAGTTLPVIGFTFKGSYGHVPIAYTALDTWQELTYGRDAHGRFSAIALRTRSGADLSSAAAAGDVEVVTKTQAYDGSPGFTAETATMTLIRGFLLVIAALVVGAFFTVWTIQRARQIALLKAMGASNTYVVRDALGQLLVVLVLAVGAGALVGAGAGQLVRGTVPFSLSVGSVLATAALLALLAALGSLVALRRIVRVDPALPLNTEP